MRLRGHRPVDYVTIAETMLLAVAIEIGLRLSSMTRVLDRLDRLGPGDSRVEWRPSYPLDRFAAAAYRLLPIDSTCLRKSLVLYALLRRRGATPQLCVGVKKDGNHLAAHAWIECGDITTRGGHTSFEQLTSQGLRP
jgi:hypothetical protein